MVNPKLLIGGLLLLGAFGAGWQINGWRLNSKHQEEELARREAYQTALQERTDEINRINRESQDREAALLQARATDQEFIAGLQNEINTRPVIRQEVRVPVEVDGRLVCPAVPTVDWGVFQDLYNRAAAGATQANTPGGGDAVVPTFAVDDSPRPRVPLGD